MHEKEGGKHRQGDIDLVVCHLKKGVRDIRHRQFKSFIPITNWGHGQGPEEGAGVFGDGGCSSSALVRAAMAGAEKMGAGDGRVGLGGWESMVGKAALGAEKGGPRGGWGDAGRLREVVEVGGVGEIEGMLGTTREKEGEDEEAVGVREHTEG